MTPFNQNNQDQGKEEHTMELQKKTNALLMPALEKIQRTLKEGDHLIYPLEEGEMYTLDMRFDFDSDEHKQALEDGIKSDDDYLFDLLMEEKGGEIELPEEIGQLVDHFCEDFLQLSVSCDVEMDRIFVSSKAYVSFA